MEVAQIVNTNLYIITFFEVINLQKVFNLTGNTTNNMGPYEPQDVNAVLLYIYYTHNSYFDTLNKNELKVSVSEAQRRRTSPCSPLLLFSR